MINRVNAIAVYGAGSWGTALAIQLARNGVDVMLWGQRAAHMQALQTTRRNLQYLPDAHFPSRLQCTSDLAQAAQFCRYHLVVIASSGIRDLLRGLKAHWQDHAAEQHLLCASKGIEQASGFLMHQVFAEEVDCAYGIISGPSFAAEVAEGLPTALTIASSSATFAQQMAEAFASNTMRVYLSEDVRGVELGGAVKNVLAIAAGISDGLGFGANARAALITRGLAEITRLALTLGATPSTLMGLAGMGDLVLTCTDNQSRNRRLGLALGQGQSLNEALAEIGQAVEGVKTAQSVHYLAQKSAVEMPICQAVYQVLFCDLSAHEAVEQLLSRKTTAEH